MSNLFNISRNSRPKKNAFNLSHEKKMSMNMAKLTPFYMEEVIPGDSFKVKSEILMRLAPLVSPVMHRVNVFTHYFFVPNRLVWSGWQDFITGGEDGLDSSRPPQMVVNDSNSDLWQKGGLSDYFGIPIPPESGIADPIEINAMPFRAYQMIYNEYYRDQNLQTKIDHGTSDNVASEAYPELLAIRDRNWEKDYFTSALPFAQKGDPVNAPITLEFRDQALIGNSVGFDGNATPDTLSNSATGLTATFDPGGSMGAAIDNIDPKSTGIDINELRTAVRLQEFLEKNARAGSRYVESILAHFGERVPDYTAQRPIFLGGGKQPVVISEVLQTSETTEGALASPQGNMSGHGISVGKSNGFKSKFTEHGYIIGIVSVLPRTAYQQGLERTWSKKDKFDYFWPEFSQLGEQEVLQKEIHTTFEGVADAATFGYQSRYAEYKYKQSMVAGDFRDNLAFWHMGRVFTLPPALNDEFIKADPRTDIFAVEDETQDHLYVQIYNSVKAVRPIPTYNTPTL